MNPQLILMKCISGSWFSANILYISDHVIWNFFLERKTKELTNLEISNTFIKPIRDISMLPAKVQFTNLVNKMNKT